MLYNVHTIPSACHYIEIRFNRSEFRLNATGLTLRNHAKRQIYLLCHGALPPGYKQGPWVKSNENLLAYLSGQKVLEVKAQQGGHEMQRMVDTELGPVFVRKETGSDLVKKLADAMNLESLPEDPQIQPHSFQKEADVRPATEGEIVINKVKEEVLYSGRQVHDALMSMAERHKRIAEDYERLAKDAVSKSEQAANNVGDDLTDLQQIGTLLRR